MCSSVSKMAAQFVICLTLLSCVFASEDGTKVPGAEVVEKLWLPTTYSARLVQEKFTKGVFTVPGYTGKEKRDSEEPPFEPSLECGDQLFNLTEGSFGTITSPNYPDAYPPNQQCEWIIEGIPGTVVEATFFDIVTQPWLFTFTDYVLVSNTGNWDEYRRFSGDANSKLPFTFISQENRLAVRFVSSRWLNFRGFKMSYVVRAMKESDESPGINEYGSAFNNDLVAVCSSKPITLNRINTKYNVGYADLERRIAERVEKQLRIVNGLETMPHEYPFAVIILTNQGAFCGGSLIDEYHVLTAAHCLENEDSNEELQVVDLVFGAYNLTNRAENLYSRQFRSVQYPDIASNVFIHPNYDYRSGANDIAIVRVNKVKINKYVQPVFLPSVYTESNPFTGWTLRTVGWGSVDGDKSKIKLTPVLRQASATVVPTSQCRQTFSGSITGNHICTLDPVAVPEVPDTTTLVTNSSDSDASTDSGSTEISADEDDAVTTPPVVEYQTPCHGDSGGPLLAEFDEGHNTEANPNKAGPSVHDCVNPRKNGDGNGTRKKEPDTVCQRPKGSKQKWYVQVGVLSYGSQVCGRGLPVTYTRLTAYLQWIAYITGRHG